MAFLTALLSVAENIQQPGGIPWEWLIMSVFDFVANYGWRMILFTVLLKLVLYPLDFFQRYKMRKNEKITKRLKPEMDKLKKACADNTQLYQQKQMELNRREGYSYFSACLPAIATMVIFIWLFSSLNSISQFMNMKQYIEWNDVYTGTYEQVLADNDYDSLGDDEKQRVENEAVSSGQQAVYDFYYSEDGNKQSILWIKNIWSPDVPWKKPIAEWSEFEKAVANYGNGKKDMGINADVVKEMMNASRYNVVTEKLRTASNNSANGFLILPILAMGLSFLSQFITSRQQKKSGQDLSASPMGGGSMKFMMVLFPLIMGFFSLMYTASFTLYMVVNSGMTILLNLLTTFIFFLKDNTKEKTVVSSIQKYGRPDPNDYNKNKK